MSDEVLMDMISDLLIRYSYIENVSKYVKTILEKAKEYIKLQKNNNIEKDKIEKLLEASLLDIIFKEFENVDFALKTTDSFIYNNLKLREDYLPNMKEFNKLSRFFSKIEYVPSFEFVSSLLKNNNIINSLIEKIYEHNVKK